VSRSREGDLADSASGRHAPFRRQDRRPARPVTGTVCRAVRGAAGSARFLPAAGTRRGGADGAISDSCHTRDAFVFDQATFGSRDTRGGRHVRDRAVDRPPPAVSRHGRCEQRKQRHLCLGMFPLYVVPWPRSRLQVRGICGKRPHVCAGSRARLRPCHLHSNGRGPGEPRLRGDGELRRSRR
jgi:hypothetical protein